MSLFVQFLIGLLFGTGLVVAGMSDPQKVINFLDVASLQHETWDPSLAFVMAGGVLVTFIGYRLVLKRPAPIFDTQFHLPHKTAIDRHVIIGPAIFGIGWGLAGFCPGPAFTAVGTASGAAILFAVAMLAGMFAARLIAAQQLQLFTTAKKA